MKLLKLKQENKMKQFQIIYKQSGLKKESATVDGVTRKEARAYFWETLTQEEKNSTEIIDIVEIED